ncbi:MAG: SpoIIE family protein phosphatase [Polyangiaceae bacterium]|nr:SpoIIE family protein phosphatase [Polyangiaceae bacterium]
MARPRLRFALLLGSLNSEYECQIRRSIEIATREREIDLVVVTGQRLGAPAIAEAAQNGVYALLGVSAVDGVIVVSSTLGHFCSRDALAALCRSYAPLPVCSLGVALDGIPSVVVDNASGMEVGVTHLIEIHQCRRIAFIAGPRDSTESEHRLAGYRAALHQRGLEVDGCLVQYGEFTMATGATAMRTLLDSGAVCDAVVAANDSMALGAMDVIQSRGFNVPRDIAVLGFDDISLAQIAKPSLTSLRQPLRWMGARAVETIVLQLDGEVATPCASSLTELVRRESCGCGYELRLTGHPEGISYATLADAVVARRQHLIDVLDQAVSVTSDALGSWPARLLDALEEELIGNEGRFVRSLEYVLERAGAEGASLDEFQRVVSLLRTELRSARVTDRVSTQQAERLWHTARVVVGAASVRAQGRQRMDSEHASYVLGRSAQRFATALSLPSLREALAQELPGLGIDRAAVSLYVDSSATELRPLFLMLDGQEVEPTEPRFPASDLAPSPALEPVECQSSVVVPLTFEASPLGIAVLAGTATTSMYEPLRQQIASAIKSAALHREVIQQVALRERLEQERMRDESRVAVHIQTTMIPATIIAPGLEFAAVMLPAAEAGGDFYDVLGMEDSAWLAIGDVAGHGLGAGMIMLMVQSMVAALTRVRPELPPSEIVSLLNEALYENVRHRLKRNEHVTLTVLRYGRDGRIRFAGAHEEIIVWRANSGLCETVTPPGFWVGAMPNVREITTDAELVLHEGDLLVLHTDGLTEARNAHHEQFGFERLVAAVEQLGSRPVEEVRDRILELVDSWCASFDDDRTLVVARYRSPR